MTPNDLWHLKIGTRVCLKDWDNSVVNGTVVRRNVDNEVYGFVMLHNKNTGKIETKDLNTGKKLLTVTVKFDNGYVRYYDTSGRQYGLKDLTKI